MNNPYQNISEPVSSDVSLNAQGEVNQLTLNALAQQSLISAKGWVRFLSVIGFISFAMMLVAIIGMLVTVNSFGGGSDLAGFFIGQLMVVAVMAIITFLFSLRLSRFASSIKRMMVGHQAIDFEAAMVAQNRIWTLAGVLMIVWLVLMLIVLAV